VTEKKTKKQKQKKQSCNQNFKVWWYKMAPIMQNSLLHSVWT